MNSVSPAIVIPCDDRAVYHLHELHLRARRQGPSGQYMVKTIENSLGPPETYPIVGDRYKLIQAASEEGVRVAATRTLHTLDDLEEWQSAQTGPCVLKADGTEGGYGVRIAYSPDEARKSFHQLTRLLAARRVFKRSIVNRDPFWLRLWWRQARPTVVVQRYIQGRPANCAVVCRQGRVLAGIAVEVVCASGPTEPASVVRVVNHAEMISAAERIARRLHLSGFFGLDFIINCENGAAHLIEMNPRITPQCHLRLGSCRDMVGALIAEWSEKPVVETPPVTLNDMIAYFPQAWSVGNELFQSSFQDVPSDEPELVQELLNPWQDQTLLVRLLNCFYRQPGQSNHCIFTEAVAIRPGQELM
jgi:carbamoylphosphate synthase large subunit